MTEFVQIAGRSLPVVPQPHARLRHHLTGEDFQRVLSGDYSSNAYRILGILIPELPRMIPEHAWEGFPDAESLERYRGGDRDAYSEEAAAASPDFDQIARAFEVALKVNGGERVGKLLGLVQTVTRLEASATSATATTPTMPPSLATPGANGA